MVKALENQLNQPQIESMGFEERLGLMVDREICDRETRKLQTRLRNAALKQEASIEDIDYKASRGIDKKLIFTLANCQWIKNYRNVLIIGATGTGKNFLACALAHKACLEGNIGFCQISVLLEKPPQYLVLSAMLKYQLYVPFSFCDSHLTKPKFYGNFNFFKWVGKKRPSNFKIYIRLFTDFGTNYFFSSQLLVNSLLGDAKEFCYLTKRHFGFKSNRVVVLFHLIIP